MRSATAGAPPDDPALAVWREAAWCHRLFATGTYAPAAARLRVVFRSVTGAPPDPAEQPASHAEALCAAADLFARM